MEHSHPTLTQTTDSIPHQQFSSTPQYSTRPCPLDPRSLFQREHYFFHLAIYHMETIKIPRMAQPHNTCHTSSPPQINCHCKRPSGLTMATTPAKINCHCKRPSGLTMATTPAKTIHDDIHPDRIHTRNYSTCHHQYIPTLDTNQTDLL